MAQVAMYPLRAGGKETLLTADVTASDTTFYLDDLTNIPTAPNLITIKTSSALWERCRYTARVVTSGVAGYITAERSGNWHASSASGNAALSWGTGSKVLRAVSESDFTALQSNILDHESRIPPNTNLIINGGFTVNQRSYVSGATLSSGVYGHDRWKAGSSGGNYTFTQLNSSTTITIASGKSIIQVIEDKNVEGGSYVLSWSGTAAARYGLNSATPSGSYVSSPILITGQTAGTVMSIEFGSGTLTKVKLEVGSTATPYVNAGFSNELIRCMRYYQRSQSSISSKRAYFYYASGNSIWADFPVVMRTAPTCVTYFDINDGAEQNNTTLVVSTTHNVTGFLPTITSGWYVDFHYYTADAEL